MSVGAHVAECQSLHSRTGANPEVPSRAAASHRVRTKDHGWSSTEPLASSWLSRGRVTGRVWPGTHLSLRESWLPDHSTMGQQDIPLIQMLLRATFQVPRIF